MVFLYIGIVIDDPPTGYPSRSQVLPSFQEADRPIPGSRTSAERVHSARQAVQEELLGQVSEEIPGPEQWEKLEQPGQRGK